MIQSRWKRSVVIDDGLTLLVMRRWWVCSPPQFISPFKTGFTNFTLSGFASAIALDWVVHIWFSE